MSFSELLLTRRVDSSRPSYPSPMGCDLCFAEFGEPSQLRDAVMGGCALNFIDLACHAYDIKQPNVAPRLPGSNVSTKHLDDESKNRDSFVSLFRLNIHQFTVSFCCCC